MKRNILIITLLYSAFIIMPTNFCFGDITYTLDFYPADFDILTIQERDGNYYSVITSIDKSICQANDSLGYPQLPEKIFCFSLPLNQDVDYVVINQIMEIPLTTITNQIRPIQTDWITSTNAIQPPFERIKPTVYQTNDLFPRQSNQALFVRQDYVRGNKIASVLVKPVRYNPVTGEISLARSMTIRLVTHASVNHPAVPGMQSQDAERITLSLLRAIVQNKDELPANIPHVPLIRFKPGQGYPSPSVPPQCIVITDYKLVHKFSPYGQWLTSRGIPTKIIDVTTVYNNYQGIDNQEKIRNYIIDQYRLYGIYYVILGGDLSIIPGRLIEPYDADHIPDLYSLQISDLYYADVDGIWDYDRDGLYGELTQDQADMGADVFVGRVPARTEDEVAAWVTKRLCYEKNPGNGNYDYLSNAVVSNADQMRDLWHYRDTYNVFPSFFNLDTISLIEQPDGGSGNPTGPTGEFVVSYFNTRHPSIWASENHGSPDFMAMMSSSYNSVPRSNFCSNSEIVFSGDGLIDDIELNSMHYLHFSIACDLGMMDCRQVYRWWTRFPCYAQTDLFNRGGSVTGRYNTRWGWIVASHYIEQSFYELLFIEEGQHRVSFAHYMAKLMNPNIRDIDFGNTLFGCPVLTAWTNSPRTMAVSYPRYLNLTPETDIIVDIQVKSNNMPVSGVQVTLWKECEVYVTAFTDITGRVTLVARPKTIGPMSIVCAKPNYLPFERTITVTRGVHVEPDIRNHNKIAEIKPILIWNPHQLASGDSLFSTFRAAGYQATLTNDLTNYIDDLMNYSLFVIGGIEEYGEPKLMPTEVAPILTNLLNYIANGGAIYWEGSWSLSLQSPQLVSYFSFDTYTTRPHLASYLRGIDSYFSSLDSLGYDEGSTASYSISHYPNNVGNVIVAPEAGLPPMNTKAAINNRAMVTNFSWAKLNDRAINTRVELAEALIEWIATASDIKETNIAQEYSLRQNYPNPFNSSTSLSFSLPAAGHAKLDIYNILGQKVAVLADAIYQAGTYQITWNPDRDNTATGVYFAVLTGDWETKIVRMTMIK